MSDEIVDQTLVAELKDVMGEGFPALVESFQADADNRIAALKQHLAENDASAVRQQAHSFKGSSGNVGAVQVASLCLKLEGLADDGDLGDAQDVLDALRQALDSYLAAVR